LVEISNKHGIANVYNNLGIIYTRQNKFPDALAAHEKALKFREEIGDNYGIAFSYNNIGVIYFTQNNFSAALEYNLKALKIREEIQDSVGIALSMTSVGSCYYKLKDASKGAEYCKKSLVIAEKAGDKSAILEANKALSEIYGHSKNFDLAYKYQSDYMALRDSMINEDNLKQSVRAEMNYEFAKKDAMEKIEQEKRDALAEIHEHRQKLILWGVSGILVLVLAFAVFAYRSSLQKQKANNEISAQKHIIEEKQKEILDSIQYAQRIQTAMLTADSYLSKYLNDFFILYQPKDIVSGDFYWALEHGGKFYLITADCTGHGVPGAFMSLINISYLNEIIIEKEISRPDLVLNEVRNSIIKALNTDKNTGGKDGMDCTLCAFDFKNNILEYASANNLSYIARNNELISCQPDKMHVGLGEKTDSFTYNRIELQKGDIVYTFTDGYADQFGGPKGKKMKHKQLEEMLRANCQVPLAQQKEILQNKFIDWKGSLEQVDDVLIMAVKV